MASFDVWFDGSSVDAEILQYIESQLQLTFNLPLEQATILVNGETHRIKRNCSLAEAEQLSTQFESWGGYVSIVDVNSADSLETATKPNHDKIPPLTLAAAGETIPNYPRDRTPPKVRTDHLQLEN